jgi:hypothetical protein
MPASKVAQETGVEALAGNLPPEGSTPVFHCYPLPIQRDVNCLRNFATFGATTA